MSDTSIEIRLVVAIGRRLLQPDETLEAALANALAPPLFPELFATASDDACALPLPLL